MVKYKSERRWTVAAHCIMIFLTACTVFPFLLLISASFTDESAAIMNGYTLIPTQFSLEAYEYILKEWAQIGHAYLITIIVTAVGTLTGVIITCMLAYGLARRVPFAGIVGLMIVISMLFSGGIVSTYYIYSKVFHIRDTLWALIVPGYLTSAMSIMLVRNYFAVNIPEALIECAQIDGAKELTIFAKICLPLSKPILATIGLTQALVYWNDWTNGLYYLDNPRLYGIQTVLNKINESANYLASNSTNMSLNGVSVPSNTMRMAMAILGILPILAVYPFFQEYFAKGITIGAVKG